VHQSDAPNLEILVKRRDRNSVRITSSESDVRRTKPEVQNMRNNGIHRSESSGRPESIASPIGRGRRGKETAVMNQRELELVDVQEKEFVFGKPIHSDELNAFTPSLRQPDLENNNTRCSLSRAVSK
jgi:hypothetical protein